MMLLGVDALKVEGGRLERDEKQGLPRIQTLFENSTRSCLCLFQREKICPEGLLHRPAVMQLLLAGLPLWDRDCLIV